ncbi:MAG: hypothetical protein M3256_02000 [Actinomycetota bacterium]|nr:hypothetical protein [Actinomycetota bacterium]
MGAVDCGSADVEGLGETVLEGAVVADGPVVLVVLVDGAMVSDIVVLVGPGEMSGARMVLGGGGRVGEPWHPPRAIIAGTATASERRMSQRPLLLDRTSTRRGPAGRSRGLDADGPHRPRVGPICDNRGISGATA